MQAETQKTDTQTTVRISGNTKERIQRVVRKMADKQDRRVTEVEVADQILTDGLPAIERELGIPVKE